MKAIKAMLWSALLTLICVVRAAGTSSPQLPAGWTQHLHQESGKTYYYNKVTGVSSWSIPIDQGKAATPLQDVKQQEATSQPSTAASEALLAELEQSRDLVKQLQDKLVILELENRNLTASIQEEEEETSSTLTASVEELEDARYELEAAKEALASLEEELQVLKQLSRATTDFLEVTRANVSALQTQLHAVEQRFEEQSKELSEAYEEIAILDSDLKSIAEPSMRRTKKMSTFRSLVSYMAPFSRSREAGKPKISPPKGKATALHSLSARETSHNQTLALLRENITALTLALESKELLIAELAEQLEDQKEDNDISVTVIEELREKLHQLTAEKERVEFQLSSRESELQGLRDSLAASLEESSALQVRLALSEDAVRRMELAHEEDLLEARREAAVLLVMEREEAALELADQEDVIDSLKGMNRMLLEQLNNATDALNTAQRMLLNTASPSQSTSLSSSLDLDSANGGNGTKSDVSTSRKKCFFGLF